MTTMKIKQCFLRLTSARKKSRILSSTAKSSAYLPKTRRRKNSRWLATSKHKSAKFMAFPHICQSHLTLLMALASVRLFIQQSWNLSLHRMKQRNPSFSKGLLIKNVSIYGRTWIWWPTSSLEPKWLNSITIIVVFWKISTILCKIVIKLFLTLWSASKNKNRSRISVWRDNRLESHLLLWRF